MPTTATSTTSNADLITHPVRARVLVALMGRALTTAQIARLLPDVPRASLYRQVRRLHEGGMLEVVRETPVRGTVEKVYAVRRDAGGISPEESAAASPADHLRTFAAFLDTMATVYRAYLGGGRPVDHPSQVTMFATPIYADDGQYERFREGLRSLLDSFPRTESSAGGAATRRVVWVASVPDPADPGIT